MLVTDVFSDGGRLVVEMTSDGGSLEYNQTQGMEKVSELTQRQDGAGKDLHDGSGGHPRRHQGV